MKSIHKIFLGTLTAVLLAACADDNDFARDSRKTNTGAGKTVTVTASMPGNNSISKVGLSQENNTLNMISQWEQDDEIQLFVYQGGNSIEIGKTPVQNISDDGKSCLFSFVLPKDINPEKTYYVYGLCGIDGSLDDGELTFDAPLKRVPLSEIKAPCFFAVEGNSDELQVRFNHIGAYEILHLANKSDNSITFSHNGYTSETPWYNSGFHGSLKFGTTSKSITYSGKNATADIQKVTINSGETASIVSWYYPNGNTISDAVLNAVINGSEINSSDIKSSKTVIQNGKAYHLYATWNGKELKFKETDPFVIEDDIPSEYQENYFDGTLKKVYTCDYGAKTITLYKSVDFDNYHTNPDGADFYLSTFYLDVTDEKGTTHTLITDEVYTSANYDFWQLPCMLIDGGKNEISIYSISKDGNPQYSMEGYLFRYDMSTGDVSKESVFDYANWGWFPRFEVSDNVVKLHHFSYAGYYAMESVRNSDGAWNTDYLGSINPDDYEQEAKDKPAVLIMGSNNEDDPKENKENYFDGTLKKVYTCDYGAKTITLYKSVDHENSHVNPDGTLFYLSTFYLDVTDGKGTTHTLITDELYTSANYDLMNLPCMLIDGGKDEISIYSMSKDENQQYSMEGYLFRYDMATEKVTKESVFDYANWGWFPRFELSDNVVKLRHFSYAGYYAMESVCNSDGIWNTDYIGSINPDDYEKETKDKPAVLIIDSNEEEDPEDNTVALSKGLVAYYPFDTNADDYSGNGNNGTVTNLSLVSGVNGNAYNFAGVDDPGWIQIPNSESLQFSDAASFSMWFNVSSYRGHDGWANTTDYGCLKLFSKDYDRNEIHADLGGFTDDKWRISFWGICNGREGNWIDIEGSILNQWHHVAFVATNNYLKIYIDGNLVNETECESNFSYSNSKDLWIGRLNSYYAYYFNGLIDEFRVYNRALNSTEVSELYNMYEPENEPIQQDVSKSYVDLGLPSGTLWATCNVGAKNPWESGDYFAWGETEPKTVDDEELYTFKDSPSELDSKHDAATVNMGSEWKMPTYKQWEELRDNCEWEYTTNYNGTGVAGFLVYGVDSRSKFIFLPIQSYKENGFCFYWLSSIYEPTDGYAWCISLLPPDEVSAGYASGSCWGYRPNSVRAVRR